MSRFFLAALVASILVSCKSPDPVVVSDTPSIAFKSIRKFHLKAIEALQIRERDSVVITLAYQDGDNDLGEERFNGDSTRLKAVFGSQSWGNYQIKPFVLSNGQYTESQYALYSKIFFSPVKTELNFLYGTNFSLDSVAHTLDFYIPYFYSTNKHSLIPTKFHIKIRDRKLNESNVIETDTVPLPYPIK